MLRASTAVALIFLLARACSLCAQESTCTKRIIPVGILDLHGVVPLDLGVNTFTAEFDRKPLEITAATLFTGPKRQRAGVRLHVFLLRDFLWTGDPFPDSDDIMTLARATGGAVIELHPRIHRSVSSGTTENFTLSPERQQIVSDDLTLLYRQTANPYLLDMELPAVLKRSRGLKLSVVDQQRRKSMFLFYPRQIVPCEGWNQH